MRIDKAWGWEEVIVNNSQYCGKILHLDKGAYSSLHLHKLKHETFYVLRGNVDLQYCGKIMHLVEGDTVEILPQREHRFYGATNAEIIEFSTPHSDDDVFRITPSRPAEKVKAVGAVADAYGGATDSGEALKRAYGNK